MIQVEKLIGCELILYNYFVNDGLIQGKKVAKFTTI